MACMRGPSGVEYSSMGQTLWYFGPRHSPHYCEENKVLHKCLRAVVAEMTLSLYVMWPQNVFSNQNMVILWSWDSTLRPGGNILPPPPQQNIAWSRNSNPDEVFHVPPKPPEVWVLNCPNKINNEANYNHLEVFMAMTTEHHQSSTMSPPYNGYLSNMSKTTGYSGPCHVTFQSHAVFRAILFGHMWSPQTAGTVLVFFYQGRAYWIWMDPPTHKTCRLFFMFAVSGCEELHKIDAFVIDWIKL